MGGWVWTSGVHCMYVVEFEWDAAKARSNLAKHGIDFADAVTALEDASALTIEELVDGEQRFVTLGLDAIGRPLVVVYTFRSTTIRVISARKATPAEERQYWSTL